MQWAWWLGAGAAAGLAMLSKYTAVLPMVGAAAALLSQPDWRSWLRRPHPWAAAVLALLVFSPQLAWNAAHHWASFAFQGGRAAAVQLQPFGPLATLAGEALFVLPWIWAGLVLALWHALRAGRSDGPAWLLACAGLPAIVLFAAVSLWSRHVLFHWAAPGYLMLFPLLGRWLASWRPATAVLRATAVLTVLGLLLVVGEIRTHALAGLLGRADPGLEARTWSGLGPALAARGLLDRPSTVIAGPDWAETGKLAVGLGPGVPVICLNVDCRQFGITGAAARAVGQDVLIVGRRLTLAGATAAYGALFDRLDPVAPLTLDLPGRGTHSLPLVLGHGLRRLP